MSKDRDEPGDKKSDDIMSEIRDIFERFGRPAHAGSANGKGRPFDVIKGGRGGRGGTGGFGGGFGSLGRAPLFLGAALLLVWGALSSFYTVDISEEAVVTRFGAYVRTSPSGFHFKLPFGMESVHTVQSKKILQEEFGFRSVATKGGDRTQYEKDRYAAESLMLTGDLNVADVEWTLQYRIADPWKYLFHARDVQRNIRDVSLSIMRRVVGDRLVSEVLTTGRVEIADQAKQLTQEVLSQYDMGVVVERIILQGVNPPEKVKPVFNEVNAAKQEQEQTINVAEREYNKIIPEARGKAEKLIADAEAFSIDIVNRAKGDASQFASVAEAYKAAPDITRKRLYLDSLDELVRKAQRIVVLDHDMKGLLPVFQTPLGHAQDPAAAQTNARAAGAAEADRTQ